VAFARGHGGSKQVKPSILAAPAPAWRHRRTLRRGFGTPRRRRASSRSAIFQRAGLAPLRGRVLAEGGVAAFDAAAELADHVAAVVRAVAHLPAAAEVAVAALVRAYDPAPPAAAGVAFGLELAALAGARRG